MVFIGVQSFDDASFESAFSIRFCQINHFLLCIPLFIPGHQYHLGPIHPFGVGIGFIDNSDLTGIEKDQGSNGINANEADEDLEENGVEMDVLSLSA